MELFNQHYISRAETSSGKKPLSLGNSSDISQNEMTVKEIISVCGDHPSIQKIKNLCVPENKFDLSNESTNGIKIIKLLNVNKAKRPDGINENFFKISAIVIDSHLANIVNNISLNSSSKAYFRKR